MTPERARWAAVIAYMAFIFLLSSIPSTPALPGRTDKHLHALLYGGFGLVVMRALARGRPDGLSWAMVVLTTLIAALYGLSDEFHQSFVPGRQPDAADVVADTVGAALAAGGYWWWGRGRSRTEPPPPV